MLSENGIARRYLSAQKKRTVLLTLGVVLSIALISALFSMLNLVQDFDVRMEVQSNGPWHVMAADCTPVQAAALQKRVDVSSSGKAVKVEQDAQLDGTVLQSLMGADTGGFAQRYQRVLAGRLPSGTDELALESWTAQKIRPGARVGDTFTLSVAGETRTYRLVGLLEDVDQDKTGGVFRAWLSLGGAQALNGSDKADVLMQVAGGVDIDHFVGSIEHEQHLAAGQIARHTVLLAALGRSHSKEVLGIYAVGAVLAALVLFAAIVMIYNAFNMSVTQRIRQFGLLRAVGATPAQIRRMVRGEALQVSFLGVLPGVVLGAAVTIALNLFLRQMFPVEFGGDDAPLFFISWPSLAIGAAVGVAGTWVSALRPARRAGKVSPVEAIAASGGTGLKKRRTMGAATHILPVEAAIALRQVLMRKRAFLLTAVSLAFGILLMLAFSPVTDFLIQGTRHNFDLGDVYAIDTAQGQGFSDATVRGLSKIGGVQSLSAKRVGMVDATFSYSLLGGNYARSVNQLGWHKAVRGADGMVQADGKSMLAGLSDTDIRALQGDLISGSLDPAQMNRENGVLLMMNTTASMVNISDLKPGDTIRVNGKALKISGIVQANMVLYAFDVSGNRPFMGMYTTNQILHRFLDIQPNLVTMKLRPDTNGDTVAARVKELTAGTPNVTTGNQQPAQKESRNLQLVGNVFLYGFIGVIGLIGVLNILNTVSTNVLVRTREIGLLRAGGMTMGQVTAMLVSESVLYGVLALAIGLAAGIPLNHWFSEKMVESVYGLPWSPPWLFIAIACAVTVLAIFLSLVSPLRQIRRMEITRSVTVE